MELYETLFFALFIGAMLITIYKIWNILNGWEKYKLPLGTVLFISYVICWGGMFFLSILHFDKNDIKVFQLFSRGFLALNALFWIAEIFNHTKDTATQITGQRYNAKAFYLTKK